MKQGDKINVRAYQANSDGTGDYILRPAEISITPKAKDELIWVRYLDAKFRKESRAMHSTQVLRNKIVS